MTNKKQIIPLVLENIPSAVPGSVYIMMSTAYILDAVWEISIKTIHFSVSLIKYFSFTTNKYFGDRSHQKQYSGNPDVRDLSNVERVLLGFTFASGNSPISASYKYYNEHSFLKPPLWSNASYMYCTIRVFKPDCVA